MSMTIEQSIRQKLGPDGQQHFDVLPADPLTASLDECVSSSADQIGHLEGWPVHLTRPVA